MNTIKTSRNFGTKGLVIAAIIAFAATFFSACVPTPGGGGTTPSGTFNVGITSSNANNCEAVWHGGMGESCNDEKSKSILIDGDSIRFETYSYLGTAFPCVGHQWKIFFNDSTCETFINESGNIAVLGALRNINNNTNNLKVNNQTYSIKKTSSIKLINAVGMCASGSLDVPFYVDNFIVFRKKKGNDYLYFWVKIKCISKASSMFPILGKGSTASILNGKYQMNSITTGL